MAYLSKSDWQKFLKSKEHKSVKKTGISAILGDYEKALKKNDLSAQASSLGALGDKIDEVKKEYKGIKTLESYLDSMRKAAKAEEDKIAVAVKQSLDTDEDDSKSSLADSLTKLRQASRDAPHGFAVAPGNPSTGLVITRRKLGKTHVKKAIEMRGKAGPYFTGSCYPESGKFVFEFESQPSKGFAAAIKKAARLHAGMNIKVLVRGAGVEFDAEDEEGLADAGGASKADRGASSYPDAKSFDKAIDRAGELPVDKRWDALSGTVGQINRLKQEASADQSLSDSERKTILDELDQALAKANRISTAAPEQEAASGKYPNLETWAELLERCLRLDEAKRKPAIDALRNRLTETKQAIAQDAALGGEARKHEEQVITQAIEMTVTRIKEYVAAARGAQSQDLSQRLKDLETEFDLARRERALPRDVLEDVARAVVAARKALASGDQKASADALDTLEAKLKAALSVAYGANAAQDQRDKQAKIHDSVKTGIEVFKKGSFAVGTADALFKETGDLKLTKELKALADDFRRCEKDPSTANLGTLTENGSELLKRIEAAGKRLDPGKDAAKVRLLDAQKKVVQQTLQRARLLELAQTMEQVGPPPWTEAQQDQMAELQVSFFFEEGAIRQGQASFGAPQLGGGDSKGVNEAWWIQRADGVGQGSTRTYIFKAQDLEATQFHGIPKNGGAAREVLASKMSDALVGYGFDVGVCPTHPVKIDTAKLGGLESGAGARTFGAVQELADNDGPIANDLMRDPEGLKKSLSHKNVSDVAVFDLMFLSLDRHAKNLLVKKQPDGSTALVPIDHGIGLPDEDGLALNRARLTGAQNTLMGDEFRPDEPIDPETRANLLKIDARAMTEELKAKQLEAARRHPEIAGKLDPAEFDRMARRIEFMQVASGIMTSRQMTQAIARYSKQIQAAQKRDLPQLAQRLKDELSAANAAMAEVKELAKGSFPYKQFQALGWFPEMSKERIEEWAAENPAFVARILKMKMGNPDALAEVRELSQRINDSAFEKTLSGKPLGDQLAMLRKKIVDQRRNREKEQFAQVPEKESDAVQLVQQLGGATALQEVKAAFGRTPVGDTKAKVLALRQWDKFKAMGGLAELRQVETQFPGKRPQTVEAAIEHLEHWQRFNQLGGMRGYIDIGGVHAALADAVRIFHDLKKFRDGDRKAKAMRLDESVVIAEQKKSITQQLNEARALLAQLHNAATKQKHQPAFRDLTQLYQAGKLAAVQGRMDTLLAGIRSDLTLAGNQLESNNTALEEIRKSIAEAQQAHGDVDLSRWTGLADNAADAINGHDFATAKDLMAQIKNGLEQLHGADV